jgi:hypothetical protein
MKAYIMTITLEDMEVPWTDNVFNGPNYSDVTYQWLVVDETASKAKYSAISMLSPEDVDYLYSIGDLLCIATVKRTKRKYIYKRYNHRFLQFYRSNYFRQPGGDGKD